jgi:UDP-glucose 4-epimerase
MHQTWEDKINKLKARLAKETDPKRVANLKAKIAAEQLRFELECQSLAELLLDIWEWKQKNKNKGNIPQGGSVVN